MSLSETVKKWSTTQSCLCVLIAVFVFTHSTVTTANDTTSQSNSQTPSSSNTKNNSQIDDEGLERAIKKGRAKSQGCTRCHGRTGIAILAGRAHWNASIAAYVTKELIAFRDKRRSHAVMNAVAAGLSDKDIYYISLWYESVSTK